jgi:putative membrane protein
MVRNFREMQRRDWQFIQSPARHFTEWFEAKAIHAKLCTTFAKDQIMPNIVTSLNGLPLFLAYLGAALVLMVLFVMIYVWVTPYPELALIRAGNTAAAASLSGATIGYALPLASAIAHSANWLDMLIWGLVALLVQLLVFFMLRLLMPSLIHDIPANKVSTGVWLGTCALAGGILNAACMTY